MKRVYCLLICFFFVLVSVSASGRNNILLVPGFGMNSSVDDDRGNICGLDTGVRYIHDFDNKLSLSVNLNHFIPIVEDGEIYSGVYETESHENAVISLMRRFDFSRLRIRLGGGLDLYSLEAKMGETEYKAIQLHLGLGAMADLQYTFWKHFAICLSGGVSYYFAGFSNSTPYRGADYFSTLDIERLRFSASLGLGCSF